MSEISNLQFKFPPGSILLVNGNSFVSQGIKIYSKLFQKYENKYLCNHAALIHNSGIIYESNAKGNEPRHITKYTNEDYKFWIFTNKNLAVENYNLGFSYSTGALGRKYDYSGFIRFLFKVFPQAKYKDFCSEFATTTAREYYKLQVCPGVDAFEVTPTDMLYYFLIDGEKDGWYLIGYWNGKEILNTY